MRTLTIDQPSGELKDVLNASKRDRVLVKRNGKPVALVIDVTGRDEEQIALANDPEFWRMIQQRRREPTVPWEQVKAELGITGRPARRKSPVAGLSKTKGKK